MLEVSPWKTEFRMMQHSGWSEWMHHKGHASAEDRDEMLARLENSKDALLGWVEFRAAAEPPSAIPE